MAVNAVEFFGVEHLHHESVDFSVGDLLFLARGASCLVRIVRIDTHLAVDGVALFTLKRLPCNARAD